MRTNTIVRMNMQYLHNYNLNNMQSQSDLLKYQEYVDRGVIVFE